MLKSLLFVGAIAVASATAFAGDATSNEEFHTLTIQGGQGQAVTVIAPPVQIEAPYALTGSEPYLNNLNWIPMQLGQSVNMLWVPR
jgi:hypothetical protein